MKPIIGIACISNNRSIGSSDGKLIYEMNYDMKHFNKTTVTTNDNSKRNAVIMGNNTFKSIGKPLSKRINYVITNQCVSELGSDIVLEKTSTDTNNNNDLYFYNNILTCIMNIQSNQNIEKIFVIGGASIYQICFDLNLFDELILSFVHFPKNDTGNIYFPYIDFNKYYIINRNETINVFDKKSQNNQLYTIYYLKKYDHSCEQFIKLMSY